MKFVGHPIVARAGDDGRGGIATRSATSAKPMPSTRPCDSTGGFFPSVIFCRIRLDAVGISTTSGAMTASRGDQSFDSLSTLDASLLGQNPMPSAPSKRIGPCRACAKSANVTSTMPRKQERRGLRYRTGGRIGLPISMASGGGAEHALPDSIQRFE
ncbi:hypothetical protein ACS0X5_09230 [Burkholderia gladioli]|uniref:hypothetical protein n=1 Tax=Burkholderia gladioli TaxID=28095 RepID=UPI003B983F90